MDVLLVEDSAGDVELVRTALGEIGEPVSLRVARNSGAALDSLRAASPDFILLDLNLPGGSGLEFLEDVKRDPALCSVPVLVLTSSEASRDVAHAYHLQCAAYFTKPDDDITPLLRDVIHFMRRARLPRGVTADAALRRRANDTTEPGFFEALFESATDAMVLALPDATIVRVNRAAERLLGHSPDELVGRALDDLCTNRHSAGLQRALSRAAGGADSPLFDLELNHATRARLIASTSLSLVRDQRGDVIKLALVLRDVTERKLADEKLKIAVELSPAAVVMVDASADIVLVNAQMERLFGYSRSELVGRRIETLIPERFRSTHVDARDQFMNRPIARSMGAGRELYARRKDGSEFPVEVGLTPVESTEGFYVLGTIVDISERRQAEERFRLAVEAAPSAMIMVDEDGTIVLVNAEMERLSGYPREELVGRSVEILVPGRFRGDHPAQRSSFGREPRARAMGKGRELHALRKDGTELPVEIGLNPIRTATGVYVLAAIVDITDRQRAQAILEERRRELERSNAELEQFAYVASHDLREPLRMIASYANLLERSYAERLDDRGRAYLAYVTDGAQRMQSLIRDLLAYSRVSTRGRPLSRVDADAALDRALEDLALALSDSGAEIERDKLPHVLADEAQLTELIQNLLSNAIKFRAGEAPRVHITARREGALWQFSLSDNGIGIPQEQTERIFEMFQRLHTDDEYPGTGIGLAISKRIVERHGGRIWAESTDRGALFHFTLLAADPT